MYSGRLGVTELAKSRDGKWEMGDGNGKNLYVAGVPQNTYPVRFKHCQYRLYNDIVGLHCNAVVC